MNSFPRVARTATTLGIAGALALGAASTAHAATPTATPKASVTAQGDRLIGALELKTTDNPVTYVAYGAVTQDAPVDSTYSNTEGFRQIGATYTIPAPGAGAGPIIPSLKPQLCMTAGATDVAEVRLLPCTGADNQKWTVDSFGYVLNVATNAVLRSTSTRFVPITEYTLGTYPYAFASAEGDKINLAAWKAAPETTPVVISGPTAGQSVTTKRPVVSGTGEPGASISVVTQSGKNLGTVIVAADGTWSLTPTSDIANTKPTLTVTQTATDGSTTTATVSFTIDVVSPLTAEVSFPADVTRQGTIGGAGENGATVEVTSGGTTIGSAVVATGTWSLPIPTSVGAGTHAFTVTQRVGGKVTGTVEVSKDFGAAVTATSSITGSTATISGDGATGARVVVTEAGRQVGTATVANGAYSIPVTGVTTGSHTYTVTQTAPGNIVTTATTTATRASAITVTNPVNPVAGYTPNTAFTFTGTAPKNAGTLTIRNFTGLLIARVPVNPNTGAWEWTRTNMGTSTWRLTFITGEGTVSEESYTLPNFAPNAAPAPDLQVLNPVNPAAGYTPNTAFTFSGVAKKTTGTVTIRNFTGLLIATVPVNPTTGVWQWTRTNMGTSTWKLTFITDEGTTGEEKVTLGDFAPRP